MTKRWLKNIGVFALHFVLHIALESFIVSLILTQYNSIFTHEADGELIVIMPTSAVMEM